MSQEIPEEYENLENGHEICDRNGLPIGTQLTTRPGSSRDPALYDAPEVSQSSIRPSFEAVFNET